MSTEISQSLPQSFTPEDKTRLIDTFKAENIQDYEPNRLSEEEVQRLSTRIESLIALTTNENRKTFLVELKNFIAGNGFIFSELSHGTSSDALASILRRGIHPRSNALKLQDQTVQNIGEGARGNFNRHFDKSAASEVYMGIGQGGLGTTLAYAEMVNNPNWNYNQLTLEDIVKLQADYQETLAKVGERDREAKLILEDRLAALQSALKRKRSYTEPDFPIVFGLTLGADRLEVDPQDPSLRFLIDFRPGGKYLKRAGGFDSEVAVLAKPPRGSETIKTIATPRENIRAVEAILKKENRRDIRNISFEALKLLKELDYPRVAEGYDKAVPTLNYIIRKNDKYIERALDELEKGLPPFDYSTLEEP